MHSFWILDRMIAYIKDHSLCIEFNNIVWVLNIFELLHILIGCLGHGTAASFRVLSSRELGTHV